MLSRLVPFLTVAACVGLWYATRRGLPVALALALAGSLPGADRIFRRRRPVGLDVPAPASPPRPPIPPAAAAVLLLLLPGCANWPEWRAALTACGVQLAPAGVTTGVALALHKGEGWQDALESLVGTYGECLIKAEVLKHLQGEGPPPTPQAIAAVAPVLESGGGELTARPRLQPPAVVQARARAWLALLPKAGGGSGR